jgi:hypothetical protein
MQKNQFDIAKLLSCLIFICTLATVSVQAQTGAFRDTWYNGILILTEGDTLMGAIHYEIENDLVQIDISSAVKTYSARQIWSFRIQDPDIKAERIFFALPYNVESSYKVPMLFELLTEGEVSLLAREKLVTESIPQYNYWGNNYYTRTRLTSDYFFGYANGRIKRYDGSKRDFFYLIKDNSSELKKFVNENRLRYNDRYDLVQIINYYNSLKPHSTK